jgi:hypothetical protein
MVKNYHGFRIFPTKPIHITATSITRGFLVLFRDYLELPLDLFVIEQLFLVLVPILI